MTDLEITCLLALAVIGIAAFFMVPAHVRNNRGRRIAWLSATSAFGVLSGLIALRATEFLDGCSIIRAKDSEFYLVWDTDEVMVRVVVTCGLAAAIVGGAVQGIIACFGNGGVISENEASAPDRAKEGKQRIGREMISGALAGFLGGTLVVGLPAAFILSIIRSAR